MYDAVSHVIFYSISSKQETRVEASQGNICLRNRERSLVRFRRKVRNATCCARLVNASSVMQKYDLVSDTQPTVRDLLNNRVSSNSS